MKTSQGNLHYSFYYSKYSFKQDIVVNKEIVFEGSLSNCDKNLLENIQINPGLKFVRIWKLKSTE